MTLKRMDNVLIVVEDLEAAKAFFTELGMELEGEATVKGPWVDKTVGLKGVRATNVMMRTPDGHGGIELSKFHTPPAVRASRQTRRRTRWVLVESCSPSTTSTTSSPAYAITAASSWTRSRSTRTSTDSASCAALRASSSAWRSRSADRSRPSRVLALTRDDRLGSRGWAAQSDLV